MRTAVARTVQRSIWNVDEVGVRRIGIDASEVPAASRQSRIAVDQVPAVARIIGTIHAASLSCLVCSAYGIPGTDDRIQTRTRRRVGHGDTDTAHVRRQPIRRELLPGRAAVAGVVNRTSRTIDRWILPPRRPFGVPGCRIQARGLGGV